MPKGLAHYEPPDSGDHRTGTQEQRVPCEAVHTAQAAARVLDH
jgi:hypothetical protein